MQDLQIRSGSLHKFEAIPFLILIEKLKTHEWLITGDQGLILLKYPNEIPPLGAIFCFLCLVYIQL
jgi:hypothetical protein